MRSNKLGALCNCKRAKGLKAAYIDKGTPTYDVRFLVGMQNCRYQRQVKPNLMIFDAGTVAVPQVASKIWGGGANTNSVYLSILFTISPISGVVGAAGPPNYPPIFWGSSDLGRQVIPNLAISDEGYFGRHSTQVQNSQKTTDVTCGCSLKEKAKGKIPTA